METNIKSNLQSAVKSDLDLSEQKLEFVSVINSLRNEDFLKKKTIANAMINYLNLMETKTNHYFDIILKMTANYEVLKESNDIHLDYFKMMEKETKEIDVMLDNQKYPKNIEQKNNSEYLKMLIRHEQEINELSNG